MCTSSVIEPERLIEDRDKSFCFVGTDNADTAIAIPMGGLPRIILRRSARTNRTKCFGQTYISSVNDNGMSSNQGVPGIVHLLRSASLSRISGGLLLLLYHFSWDLLFAITPLFLFPLFLAHKIRTLGTLRFNIAQEQKSDYQTGDDLFKIPLLETLGGQPKEGIRVWLSKNSKCAPTLLHLRPFYLLITYAHLSHSPCTYTCSTVPVQ